MKNLRTTFTLVTALALAVFAVGCATTGQTAKEDMTIAAGFKVITPKTAEQQTLLTSLPPGKVTPVTYKGNRYYVLPDAANNQAYVGGPKQYQTYQQLRLAKQLSNDNLEAAQMNQMAASMDWAGWGGWGAWGPVGWY